VFRPDQYIYAGTTGRQVFDGDCLTMCLISCILMTFAVNVTVPAPSFAGAPAPVTPADPLLSYLQDDDPHARAQILGTLREQGASPCRALGAYFRNGSSRVRGNAVMAMNDAGCSDFRAYDGYLLDDSAGVVAALIEAADRRVMGDAVPFLIGSLSDRRRIVTAEGTWSIGERAHRALMAITCQSFHYDPSAPLDDQRNAVTRWRQWYLAKRGLPRDEWVEEGIGRARYYAGRDYEPYRVEGLRLLAIIGPRALPALGQIVARRPGEVSAEVVCLPEEPPRVTDAVPCALVVRNASNRPLAIAPPSDGLEIRVLRTDAPSVAHGAVGGGPPPPARPGPALDGGAGILGAFADRLVDLAPGEIRRFEFTAGPVPSAGRYRVIAALSDLAAGLAAGSTPLDGAAGKRGGTPAPRIGAAPSTIEAETIVRFEQ